MRKKLLIGLLAIVMAVAIVIPVAAHGEAHDSCAYTTHGLTTNGSPAGWAHNKGWGSGFGWHNIYTDSYYANQSGGWTFSHEHTRWCLG